MLQSKTTYPPKVSSRDEESLVDTFCRIRGFSLALCWAVIMLLAATSHALADEPNTGKVERAAQAARLTIASDTPLTVSFSPSESSGEPSGIAQRIARIAGSIGDTQVWIQFLTVLLVIFSAFLSWRTARIGRFNVQVDAFQKLRTAYLLISHKLPSRFWTQQDLPKDSPEAYEYLCAMERYWYQSFDEWYITQVLHPNTLGRLWTTYYKDSILKNCKSKAMVAALIHTRDEAGTDLYRRFFKMVICRGWGCGRWSKKIDNYDEADKLAKMWVPHLAAQKLIYDAARKDK